MAVDEGDPGAACFGVRAPGRPRRRPETARDQLLRRMTEAQLGVAVGEACLTLRLHRYHTFDSRRSHAGWPDEAIWGPAGFLVRELKTESGQVSVAQRVVLDSLRAAGVDVGVWRPSDLASGRITAELTRLTGRTS